MTPPDHPIRPLAPSDYDDVIGICRLVYPAEEPYTRDELDAHRRVFPEGQFVAVAADTGAVAGAHFTLRLRLADYHIDDPWDVLTAGGSFLDHDPAGPTLYGADIMVHPAHQHRGLARALTDRARDLVRAERLWRMVGASRLPGYAAHAPGMGVEEYVAAVRAGRLSDPALTVHLRDGWEAVRPVHGYLPHDAESGGWAVVMQWVNPDCPPPPELALRAAPFLTPPGPGR